MNIEAIAKLLENIVGNDNVLTNEPMKNHTSFKVGGAADILVMPDSVESVGRIFRLCKEQHIPLFIMGNGTNLIVRDRGIRGVVVKVFDNLSKYRVIGDVIEAEAGILISRVSKIALENGLTGLEFAEGIPGTLGGAVTMNAGAYTGEMMNVVYKTYHLNENGEVKEIYGNEHQFGKRCSFIQQEGGIVLKSQLKLQKGDKTKIKESMDDFNRQRRDKQPLDMPSAGSIFKRPQGHFVGQLVEQCGLRGYRIGGAEVSNKHCGFIVNTGSATAEDIINLIEYIKSVIKQKFDVNLQTEVKIVGEEQR